MGRFSELMAEEQAAPKKRRFSEMLAQEQAGSTDPEVPATPWHMAGHQLQTQSKPPPQGSTHLADPPAADMLRLGLKATPQDRLAGAKELYPDSIVEQINDGSVVVRRPSGEVYNFDAPDMGNTLIRHARDLIPGLEPEDSNPTVQRSLNEADAAAVPELALRGGVGAAMVPLAPLALAPQVIAQTVGGNLAEKARAGINSLTAGGESRSSLDVEKDASRGGDAAGLGTALLGLAAKPFQSALQNLHARLPTWVPGAADAAARETSTTMGATAKPSEPLRQAVSDVEALGVPAEKAPLSILERANPDAGPRLKEIYSDPKVAKQAAFDERAGQDAVRSAGEARINDVSRGAQEGVHEAENQYLQTRQNARNQNIDDSNLYSQERSGAQQAHNDAAAAVRGRNTDARNATQELRLKRSERQVNARNEYTQAREDQVGQIQEARTARNQSIKEIRKSDPALDEILDTAKPRDIRSILEKHLSPDDLRVEELNSNWAALDEVRQPIAKPRLEQPVKPAKLEKTPTRQTFPPRLKAKTPEVDAAAEDLLHARQDLRLTKTGPEVTKAEDTMRAVKESGRRVKPDKPKEKLLDAPARLGIRTAVGLGTAGLSEVPGLAAKFARFAKGDKIGRKLITSPEVKNKVLQMLQDGIPDRDISRWLATTGSLAGQEAADD